MAEPEPSAAAELATLGLEAVTVTAEERGIAVTELAVFVTLDNGDGVAMAAGFDQRPELLAFLMRHTKAVADELGVAIQVITMDGSGRGGA